MNKDDFSWVKNVMSDALRDAKAVNDAEFKPKPRRPPKKRTAKDIAEIHELNRLARERVRASMEETGGEAYQRNKTRREDRMKRRQQTGYRRDSKAAQNNLWASLKNRGTEPSFESPEELWEACVGYFEWVRDNPLCEKKYFTSQGELLEVDIPRMRAMTIHGLCLWLGISSSTWNRYVKADYVPEKMRRVAQRVNDIIYEQKFTGAAANMLNANIISRDLGLAEKREVSGPDGAPIQTITSQMTPQEAAEAYASTINDQE